MFISKQEIYKKKLRLYRLKRVSTPTQKLLTSSKRIEQFHTLFIDQLFSLCILCSDFKSWLWRPLFCHMEHLNLFKPWNDTRGTMIDTVSPR